MHTLSGKFRYLLFPLALFYWGVLFWRNLFYTVGFFVTRRLPVTVVSVGNLSVGGTGKTPAVIYLARKLQDQGVKVAIISRGYGRGTSGTVLVSDGEEVRASWRETGDEPFFMAKKLRGVPIVVDEVRFRGGMYAVKHFKPDVVLLDDAFQHRGLGRDIDIVLLNSQDPPNAYKLLPYGKLREPWFHLRRADIVFWTKANLGMPTPSIRSRVIQTKVPSFLSGLAIAPVLRNEANGMLTVKSIKGKKVFGFCGIADPHSFRKVVKGLGVEIVGFEVFEDHRQYTKDDVAYLLSKGELVATDLFITTEKDILKLGEWGREEVPVYSLGIEFVPSRRGEEMLMKMIYEKLRLGGDGRS